MTRRLNIWDFDGVLADSEPVVSRLASRFPSVPYWKWWHDPRTSTEAALRTPPIGSTWELLDRLDGRHIILTARCRPAVVEWLVSNGRDPLLAGKIQKIEQVHSTSSTAEKDIPASVKKARFIGDLLLREDDIDIHFFDDSIANLHAVARTSPSVRLWEVVAPGEGTPSTIRTLGGPLSAHYTRGRS